MQNLGHFNRGTEPMTVDSVAAVQLLDLFRDPDYDVDRIVEFISQDPHLAAETIKRCNNSMHHASGRVTDVFEAVSRLGFYELYGIIAASLAPRVALDEFGSFHDPRQ